VAAEMVVDAACRGGAGRCRAGCPAAAGYGHGDLLRIAIVGALGEEVLFRGMLWDLAQRAGGWLDPGTLAATSVLFAVSHLQYNGFRLTLAAAGQVGYALAADVVLGWLRVGQAAWCRRSSRTPPATPVSSSPQCCGSGPLMCMAVPAGIRDP